MNFVSNIIWNSVEGFVEAGTRTAGGYAGDALIKAGDLIENGGRSVGNGLERRFSGYGNKISGQTYQGDGKALPSTARRPVAKRSNSLPASTKTGGPVAKTAIGAKKYPGGAGARSAVGGTKNTAGGAQKAVGGVNKTVGGAVPGVRKTVGGITGGVTAGAQKNIGGVTGGANKTLAGVAGGAQKTIGPTSKTLPKPYPNDTSLAPVQNKAYNPPKSYSASSYPTTKKTPVRAGQVKPFNAEKKEAGAAEKKPYPGTNTLPGEASRTPVKKYKPVPRLQGTAEKGKVQHIAV